MIRFQQFLFIKISSSHNLEKILNSIKVIQIFEYDLNKKREKILFFLKFKDYMDSSTIAGFRFITEVILLLDVPINIINNKGVPIKNE